MFPAGNSPIRTWPREGDRAARPQSSVQQRPVRERVRNTGGLDTFAHCSSCALWSYSRTIWCSDQRRNEVRWWRPGRPMWEPEVFRKQMYCTEESTCDIAGTFRPPPSVIRRPGSCAPLPPLVTPLVWTNCPVVAPNHRLHFSNFVQGYRRDDGSPGPSLAGAEDTVRRRCKVAFCSRLQCSFKSELDLKRTCFSLPRSACKPPPPRASGTWGGSSFTPASRSTSGRSRALRISECVWSVLCCCKVLR